MTAVESNNLEIQTKYHTFIDRTNTAKDGLLADIEAWYAKLPDDTPIRHHVGQFDSFCQRVFEQLEKEIGRSEEDITFKSQMIGTLTTQWLLLREVAVYRVEGSPYKAALVELDQEAARYYRAVRQALPEGKRSYLPASTPLITLGQIAELTLFNDQDQTPPAIINIPFGAIYDPPQSRSRLAIAHEVGHAAFNRIQGFLPELNAKFHASLGQEQNLTRQQRVVRQVIIQWLPEVVADLVGTALAGSAFAKSAFSAIAGSQAQTGITDNTHPVSVIRPYIYLKFLEYLQETLTNAAQYANLAETLQSYTDGIKPLTDGIAIFSEPFLDHRFDSIPALTKVNLAQVRDELSAVVHFILYTAFDSLGNKTFGAILIDCAVNMVSAALHSLAEERLDTETWGELIRIDTPFVLDISNLVRPTFAVPVSLGDFWCDWFGICH